MQRPILAVFCVFSFVPLSATAGNPDPLYPAGLDWKPGATCTYDGNQDGKKARWTFSVSEVSGDKILGAWTRTAGGPAATVPVVKTEKGMAFTEDMSIIHGTAMTADPGYKWLVFPLEPGKKWDGRSVVSGTTSGGQAWKVDVTYNAKVDGWEKVSAAGKNDLALRIIIEEKIKGLSGNFSGSGKTNIWMGDGACSVKKVEYKNSFRESGSMILVSE